MNRRDRILKIALVVLILGVAVTIYAGWRDSDSGLQQVLAEIPPDGMCDVRCGACGVIFQMNHREYTRRIAEAHQDGRRILCPACGAHEGIRYSTDGAVLQLPEGYPVWDPDDQENGEDEATRRIEPKPVGLMGPANKN